ncbi:MAG: selenide, water dikinase SelD, partial [Anaerolineae bacterium]
VYAMGGEVLLALNIAAFPADFPPELVSEILRGGAEKVAEAGGVIAGGHTIDDKEPKYGLAVIGLVHPQRVVTKAGAKPGDALILTKPLGVGIITTALKGDAAEPAHVEAAQESMLQLNRRAAQLMQQVGVHAATDVTGFALLGHACEMAQNSGVGMRFYVEKIPFLDGARRYAEEWLFPGGTQNNREHFSQWVHFAPDICEEDQFLLYTPETSGGLLIAVPQAKSEAFLDLCAAEGQAAWVVGEVVAGEGIEVVH